MCFNSPDRHNKEGRYGRSRPNPDRPLVINIKQNSDKESGSRYIDLDLRLSGFRVDFY